MIELEVRGIKQLSDIVSKYPAVSEKHVTKAIQRSLIRIQDKAKKSAPFGTSGSLRQNWVIQMGRFQGALASGAKSNGYPYGTAIEFGTAPHRIPVQGNPQFMLWAQRKGLNPYAVAASIAKKGTKPQPFFQKAADDSEQEIERELDKAINDILEEI